jgi:hypothetical protein
MVRRLSPENRRLLAAVAGILDEKPRPEVVLLWEIAEEDHPAWLAAGCGDLPLDEYRERLEEVEALALREGRQPIRVEATTEEMLEALAELGLPNDPQGRSVALLHLGLREE